jgi:hypothetical protein
MSDEAKVMQAWAKAVHVCSFCGNDNSRDALVMFCTPRAAICEDCIAVIYDLIAASYPKKLQRPVRH